LKRWRGSVIRATDYEHQWQISASRSFLPLARIFDPYLKIKKARIKNPRQRVIPAAGADL